MLDAEGITLRPEKGVPLEKANYRTGPGKHFLRGCRRQVVLGWWVNKELAEGSLVLTQYEEKVLDMVLDISHH